MENSDNKKYENLISNCVFIYKQDFSTEKKKKNEFIFNYWGETLDFSV